MRLFPSDVEIFVPVRRRNWLPASEARANSCFLKTLFEVTLLHGFTPLFDRLAARKRVVTGPSAESVIFEEQLKNQTNRNSLHAFIAARLYKA